MVMKVEVFPVLLIRYTQDVSTLTSSAVKNAGWAPTAFSIASKVS